MVTAARFALLAASAAMASCKPNLDDTVSIVATARVLAVRAEDDAGAAEFAPNDSFGMSALYVDSTGVVSPSPLEWAFCNAPKPLAILGPVNPVCFDTSGAWLQPLGVGSVVDGTMPTTACDNFGPNAVKPEQRPVDPDFTGGYYQPVQLLAPGPTSALVTLGQARIVCSLASSSAETRIDFTARYVRNANPHIASLGLAGAAPWAAIDVAGGTPNVVATGQHVTLEVGWPSCPPPAVPEGGAAAKYSACTGAEHYLLFNPATESLVDQREAITVAWYATSGAFDADRTGRASDDPAITSDNGWQTPRAAGPVTLWVVLRDERGGANWKQYVLEAR